MAATELLDPFERPSWLRIQAQVGEGRLRELASRYTEFVVGVFEQSEPDEVWITFGTRDDSLTVGISIQPCTEFSAERTMLLWVAQEFERLSAGYSASSGRVGANCEPAIESLEEVLRGDEEPPPGSVQVFRWCDRRAAMDGGRALGRDADVAAKVKRVLDRLAATGVHRPLVEPPAAWQERLDGLLRDFPSFKDVIQQAVRPHLTLRSMGVDHRLPPVLLVGPPGVGKTYFAGALARALGVDEPLFIPMSAETNGATLAGSSTFWANSAPGALFEALAWGRAGQKPCANPVILLDELDKCSATNSERHSPLGALYSLLERHTASRFQDQALPDVLMDASHVRFIATANEIDAIPEPLQSRLAVFHIQAPSPDERVTFARSIFRSVLMDLGLVTGVDADEEVFETAAGQSARGLRMRMEAAVAVTLAEGRTTVSNADWRRVQGQPERRRNIGFCP